MSFGELSPNWFTTDEWEYLDVPCLRSVSGNWYPVEEIRYLNELLPTDKDPVGKEVRQFLLPFVEDENRLDTEWVRRLQRRRKQNLEYEQLSSIWDWISDDDRAISLQDILKKAMNQLELSESPDWSVLISIGQWAKQINRPDLVTHVLVESKVKQRYALARKSLLAEPYVEQGQYRRQIFSKLPVIASDYFDCDPNNSGRHEWRSFFEKAGVKGNLVVVQKDTIVGRYSQEKVKEFLGSGISIEDCNNDGYTLEDFDFLPNITSSDLPREHVEALATWLEDGYRELKGTGKRRVSYFYFYPYLDKGKIQSLWAKKIIETRMGTLY